MSESNKNYGIAIAISRQLLYVNVGKKGSNRILQMLHHFGALHVTLICMTSYAITLLKYVMTIF
jgi:hypothetical protein